MTELAAPAPKVGVVEIALASSQAETRAATEVLGRIWSHDRVLPLTPELAWALLHAGNYVSVARREGFVIGAAIGFRGYDEHGVHLHSHIAGVLPAYQGSNVGFVLKQHQREWALAHGIDRITWTFDPLVARNAYFNVVKLGTTVSTYYEDFYGPLDDTINAGDQSDRCLASWQLDSPRAVASANGESAVDTIGELRNRGAAEVLTIGSAQEPVPGASSRANGHFTPPLLLCQLPGDIVALRSASPLVARQWRLALRSVLSPALGAGGEISAVTRDGWLVIAQPSTSTR